MARPKTRNDEVQAQLLASALDLLNEGGPAAIRARKVADAAGTSTGALYELFGDKAGLVRALFAEGFSLLEKRESALAATADPRSNLVDLLACTRQFALENPMLHDLMAGRPFEDFDPRDEDLAVARSMYRRHLRFMSHFLESAGSDLSPRLAAEVVVATHRGLIAGELAGTLGRSKKSRDHKYQAAVDIVLCGLVAYERQGVSP